VIESSLARCAQESSELVECFRHEGEDCPRCDGSGLASASAAQGAVSRQGVPPRVEER
jgi:hypothetical protein